MTRFLQKDMVVGLLCMAFAAFGLIQGRRYPIGTSDEMGPGYFPVVIFSLLMILGAGLVVARLSRPGEALDRFVWRPVIAVALAILVFGFTVEQIGFVLASILLVLIASRAEPRAPWGSAVLAAVATSAGASLLFIVFLKLSLPLWPRFLATWI